MVVLIRIANICWAVTVPSIVSNAVIGFMSFHPHNTPELDTHIIPFSFISEETGARVACTRSHSNQNRPIILFTIIVMSHRN